MSNEIPKLPAESFERVHIDSTQAERIVKPSLSFWQDAWQPSPLPGGSPIRRLGGLGPESCFLR